MAADRLMTAIDGKIARLSDHPESGAARDDVRPGARMLVHARYLILYEFDAATDVVEVISVVDGGRNLSELF